jgi:hypothetical protein
LRYVVEVAARVDRDGASFDGIGHRVYESWTTPDELFSQLRYSVLDGAPHRTRTGLELSVLAVRLYEADAESDDAAKELAAFGTAKLLSEITAFRAADGLRLTGRARAPPGGWPWRCTPCRRGPRAA